MTKTFLSGCNDCVGYNENTQFNVVDIPHENVFCPRGFLDDHLLLFFDGLCRIRGGNPV